jgi:hypothetical protein
MGGSQFANIIYKLIHPSIYSNRSKFRGGDYLRRLLEVNKEIIDKQGT